MKTHFDAAHYIRDYQGKCSREHGHRWGVEVVVEGKELDNKNMLVDFSIVKRALEKVLDESLDHYQLNEKLREPNVTAEFLAKWFYEQMVNFVVAGPYDEECLRLVRVTVWESPDCCVSYDGEANESTK